MDRNTLAAGLIGLIIGGLAGWRAAFWFLRVKVRRRKFSEKYFIDCD